MPTSASKTATAGIDERFLEKLGAFARGTCTPLRALQLLPEAHHAQNDSGGCSATEGSGMGDCGVAGLGYKTFANEYVFLIFSR